MHDLLNCSPIEIVYKFRCPKVHKTAKIQEKHSLLAKLHDFMSPETNNYIFITPKYSHALLKIEFYLLMNEPQVDKLPHI